MTKKTTSYQELRRSRLANPAVAAEYLNATMQNSPEAFPAALRNVAEAQAEPASAPEEQTRIDQLLTVLEVMGLKLTVTVANVSATSFVKTHRVQGK